VTCGLGMMFFPDPAQAVAEFHRVLRPGGYAAISAHPSASRTLFLRVLAAIDRHVRPQKAPSGPVTFDGHEPRLRVLYETAGFRDVETATEVRTFPTHPSMPISALLSWVPALLARNTSRSPRACAPP
jgi:ubiquinone/menaquinone biosynthesis C-methylase UbiE